MRHPSGTLVLKTLWIAPSRRCTHLRSHTHRLEDGRGQETRQKLLEDRRNCKPFALPTPMPQPNTSDAKNEKMNYFFLEGTHTLHRRRSSQHCPGGHGP